jgi:glycosyltransferase involved in cell wall biosynthesis
MAAAAVLHVTAAEGGGTDRYIRDLAAATQARHWIWHAGAGAIEDVAQRRYYRAPDDDALARWLAAARIGVLHLHGVTVACAAILERVRAARPLPFLVTLHDVAFVAPRAFDGDMASDAAAITRAAPLLAGADAVVAPSGFIAGLVHAHFPGVGVGIVAPGIDARAAARTTPVAVSGDFAPQARRLRIATVGAIGPHKGSAALATLADAFAAHDATLVVVGYTDTRIERGWERAGALYVHGAYADGTLASWLDAYDVAAVLFANRMPESFSYTLSEAWAARRPVIVPDDGALGERVAASGGGWRLPSERFASEAAALVGRLAGADGTREIAQVESAIDIDDPVRIPTLAAMKDAFDDFYARYATSGAEEGGADGLAPLLAATFDGSAFRSELVRLADHLAAQRAWNEKLEKDVAELKAAIEQLGDENRKLADVRDAFVLMPAFVQRFLIRQAFRGRG